MKETEEKSQKEKKDKRGEDRRKSQKIMTKRKKQTYKKKRRQKKANREIKGRKLRDHRGIIFASLYTIIKNKTGNIFLSGQNQCHITGVKKSYFCHTFHLSPKKFSGGW